MNARAVKCLIQAGCLSAWVALRAVRKASEDGSGPGKEEATGGTQGKAARRAVWGHLSQLFSLSLLGEELASSSVST